MIQEAPCEFVTLSCVLCYNYKGACIAYYYCLFLGYYQSLVLSLLAYSP